jgi:hypothetical protein
VISSGCWWYNILKSFCVVLTHALLVLECCTSWPACPQHAPALTAAGLPSSAWAQAESVHISAADQSATSNMRWRGGGGGGDTSSGGMQLLGLLARALPGSSRAGHATSSSAVHTVPPGAELLYRIEWQAALVASSGSPASFPPPASASAAQPAAQSNLAVAAAARWTIAGGSGTGSEGGGSGVKGSRSVLVRQRGWHSDAGWAAANLAVMQQVGAGGLGAGMVCWC